MYNIIIVNSSRKLFVLLSVENSRIVLTREQPDYIHAVAANVRKINDLI